MKKFVMFLCAMAIIVCTTAIAGATIINFDDRPGMPPPFLQGTPVDPAYLVNNQYLSLGVLFDSGGGGIFIAASSNPVSPPNAAGPTAASPSGPVIDYYQPVYAYFLVGGSKAVVDSASLTLTNSSTSAYLEAYDLSGTLLGSISGVTSATLSLSFPGQIDYVKFNPSYAAFDDFTFQGLTTPVPEPATLLLLGSGLVGLVGFRKKFRK